MFRANLKGPNKICAARAEKRYEDERQRRLASMKPAVDSAPPRSKSYAHVRQNLKRNEIVTRRYDEIERDNNHLLGKMSEMAAKPSDPFNSKQRSSSLPLLTAPAGGFARKREEERVALENTRLLRRLQRAPPSYNPRRQEAEYQQSLGYMQIRCDYPLLAAGVIATSAGTAGRPFGGSGGPLSGATPRSPGPARATVAPLARPPLSGPPLAGDDLRYVLTREMTLGCWPHFVEVATDGKMLCIYACQVDTKEVTELVVSEEDHRKILVASGGDYEEVVRGLRKVCGVLVLDLPDRAISKVMRAADSLRYVFSREVTLGCWPHFVEVATDEKVLVISACRLDTKEVTELVVSEEDHQKLLEAANEDYETIMRGLRIGEGALIIDQLETTISPVMRSQEPLRYLVNKEMTLGNWPHSVEVSTDGQVLRISACNVDTSEVTELVVSEDHHEKLLEAANGDYDKIMEGLQMIEGVLILQPPDTTPQTLEPPERSKYRRDSAMYGIMGSTDSFRYLLSREMSLGCWPYFVEVATDGKVLCISACKLDTKEVTELVVSEEDHQELLEAAGGDYTKLMNGLRWDEGVLALKKLESM